MATSARSRLLRVMLDRVNQTARADELGDFGFVILNAILARSPKATVNGIVEWVLNKTKDLIDVAQTYAAIDRFTEDRGWVKENGNMPSSQGGRAVACFAITQKGREALDRKAAHLRRLLAVYDETVSVAGRPRQRATPAQMEEKVGIVSGSRLKED